MKPGRMLVAIGGAVLIIGALLSWVSITSVDGTVITGGYEGDRLAAGAFGASMLIAAFVRKVKAGQRYFVVGSVLALIMAGLIVRNWIIFATLVAGASTAPVTVGDLTVAGGRVELGVYVSLMGSVVALIGGLLKGPNTGS